MDDDKKGQETDEQREEAAKKKDSGGGDTALVDDKARIKELEDENKQLKQQVADMQKHIDELEAESKAAANKSRAAKLIDKLEKSGMTFASDEEREKELGRLAGLSDDAFAATEAAYDRAISAKTADSKTSEAGGSDDKGKSESKSDQADKRMRTDAGVRPLDVDDKKVSLEDKLRDGFMVAYRDRVGAGQAS